MYLPASLRRTLCAASLAVTGACGGNRPAPPATPDGATPAPAEATPATPTATPDDAPPPGHAIDSCPGCGMG